MGRARIRRWPPVAEVVRQRLRARHVRLARGVGNGAIGARLRSQEILKLAFARIAPADPHFLARRRRIDFNAAAQLQPGYRIEIGHVDPVGAAVIRHAEGACLCNAAAADMVGGFEQHESSPGRGDAARGGDTGRTGADDDDVDVPSRRRNRGDRGPRGKPCRGSEERAAAQSRHGFQIVCSLASDCPNGARRGKRHG